MLKGARDGNVLMFAFLTWQHSVKIVSWTSKSHFAVICYNSTIYNCRLEPEMIVLWPFSWNINSKNACFQTFFLIIILYNL